MNRLLGERRPEAAFAQASLACPYAVYGSPSVLSAARPHPGVFLKIAFSDSPA